MLSYFLTEMSILMLLIFNLFMIKTKNCEKEHPDCFMDPQTKEVTNAEAIGGFVLVMLIILTLIMEILKVMRDTFNHGKRALGYGPKKVCPASIGID